MLLICFAVNACILAYGAVADYKRREIPDVVPIILILTGIVTGWDTILFRTAALLLTALLFLLAVKISKSDAPGGDFKLLCALAFSNGLPIFFLTLLITGLVAVFIGIIRKQAFKRHIPLCTYIAPAYIITEIALWVVMRMI